MNRDLSGAGGDAGPVIRRLQREIEAVLRPLVPAGSRCALIDFPDYPNVGDSAIWLGERALLRRLGARVVYRCDADGYSGTALARRLGDGIILISGGGNLGDLWPGHQRLRESVIAAFPGHRIIQLPQSIHFRDPASLERAREVFRRHPDLTVLVRDRPSLDAARDGLGVTADLCPDMALSLGPLRREASPDLPVLALARGDIEAGSGLREAAGGRMPTVDWRESVPTPLMRAAAAASLLASRHPRALGFMRATTKLVWERVSRQRLRDGCRLLGRGRVIITDRLHGHLLCLLLGIPHVVMDNSYGKVRACFDAWTRPWPLARWADSAEEAFAEAEALLRAATPAPPSRGT